MRLDDLGGSVQGKCLTMIRLNGQDAGRSREIVGVIDQGSGTLRANQMRIGPRPVITSSCWSSYWMTGKLPAASMAPVQTGCTSATAELVLGEANSLLDDGLLWSCDH